MVCGLIFDSIFLHIFVRCYLISAFLSNLFVSMRVFYILTLKNSPTTNSSFRVIVFGWFFFSRWEVQVRSF